MRFLGSPSPQTHQASTEAASFRPSASFDASLLSKSLRCLTDAAAGFRMKTWRWDRSLRTKHVNWSSFSTSKQLCPQPWKFSKKPLKTSQIVTQSAKSHYKSYIIKPSLGQQEYIQYIPILSSMPSSWSRMNWAPLYLNHKISHYPMYLDNKSSNHCKKNLRYLIYI